MLFERADLFRNTPASVRDARGRSRRSGAFALKRWLGLAEVDDQKPRPSGDPGRKSDERGVASAIYGLVVCASTPCGRPQSAAGFRSLPLVCSSLWLCIGWPKPVHTHWPAMPHVDALGWSDSGRSGAKGGQWSAPPSYLWARCYSWVLWVLRSLSLSVSPWPLRPCCWCGLDGQPRQPAGGKAGAYCRRTPPLGRWHSRASPCNASVYRAGVLANPPELSAQDEFLRHRVLPSRNSVGAPR